jgi:hypothetical protein
VAHEVGTEFGEQTQTSAISGSLGSRHRLQLDYYAVGVVQ